MTAGTITAVKTVLVADDTAFVRDRFQNALEGAGHRAVVVRTGPELLARLRDAATPIDLVLLDLRLPQGRGVELLRNLRQIVGSQPAVVVFSGTIASALEVRELTTLGVAGYINEYTSVQHIVPSLAPHLFPDHYNRRSSPRAVLGIPIAYRFGNTIAAALTLNISRGGLAIRTTSPLDPGTAVKLRFRLPTTKTDIDCEAKVAWVDRRVGMGVTFTWIADRDQAAIADFVQSHFFSNRKA
jgi:two-component system phosphate regulon response regulator PhoB